MCTKVLIVGGAGEMGQWFARFLMRQNYAVSITDIDPTAKEVAKKLGAGFVEDASETAVDFDIVLVSVPIDVTEEVIRSIAPQMRAGSLLMDITSIKKGPMEAMKKAPKGIELIGTHPMFGPMAPDLRRQTVILVPVQGRSEHWLPNIRELFEENGAHVEILTAEEHDQIMAIVQGLTHFAYIAIGVTLNTLNFEVRESRRFMSPVYEIMVDFMGRILAQNPHLYAMIQMNPEVKNVHNAFIAQCKDLAKDIEKGDVERFVRSMRSAAAHFGDTEAALKRSDKLINVNIAELDELAQSVGIERGLRHLYSGAVHVGIVEQVTPSHIILKMRGRRTKLKIENIQLLSTDELLQWKIDNLRHHRRDISVALPEKVQPDVIVRIISGIDGVVSAEEIDTYKIKKGCSSITFRIVILGDKKPKEVQGAVEELLKGIGGEIR
ncbi:MAG: prephenate dehydrogenase [Methanosarcinales archaeon Met12]|nr:MAG: prephenate dehydrogenase [Methanosarcinales archaeon Met12]